MWWVVAFTKVDVICPPLKKRKILENYDKNKLFAEANLMGGFVLVLFLFHSLAQQALTGSCS